MVTTGAGKGKSKRTAKPWASTIPLSSVYCFNFKLNANGHLPTHVHKEMVEYMAEYVAEVREEMAEDDSDDSDA